MKVGFSNFAGEFVEAESIGYDDCRDFQIVCPACSEPIFKVGRTVEGKALHYLSHYRASRSVVATCENRVASIGRDEMAARHAEGQRQSLEFFLAVVPDEVEKLGTVNTPKIQARLRGQKALAIDIPEAARRSWQAGFATAPLEILDGIWDERFSELALRNPASANMSPMTKRYRRATAGNILKTILSENGKSAFSRLFIQATATVFENSLTHMHHGTHTASHVEVVRLVDRMLSTNRKRAQTLYHEALFTTSADEITDGQGGDISIGDRFLSWINSEMLNALCELDYFEIMNRRRSVSEDARRLEMEARGA